MITFKIIKFIFNHPFNSDNRISGVLRFFKWQLNTKLNPYPIVYPFTENSKLIIWKSLKGATGNLYCGLMDYYDMGFLLHFLRSTDLFIDVGANIGAYTVLASGEIGASTISIEPIPSTYKILIDNILINRIQNKVQALNIGLGKSEMKIKFTKSMDTVNHVATDNEIDTIEVEVDTLDSVTNLIPTLIKIDVEGFETEVLNGAEKILNNKDLKAIIIELNGSGNRYGYDENKIHVKLLALQFKPYYYNPKTRVLTEVSGYVNSDGNALYIRDKKFVIDRVTSSRKIKILNSEI
ncbi:MAG: FkbM family methyltransferase [Bacteroidetes bacterium]|nr:FkbM family methyltransferase [Bacteroidota bacterium]